MNEWEFTGLVANWITVILHDAPELPFLEARCEQRGKGSLKRRDLTLLDKNQQVVLTGEVKLPYAADGKGPQNPKVVADARRKARRAKTPRFFFTWNVNKFVLWETSPPEDNIADQGYRSWDVTSVHKASQLELPSTHADIKTWLETFLEQFERLVRGQAKIGWKSPDARFVEALESALHVPIMRTYEEIFKKYKTSRRSASQLDSWMSGEQGWTIVTDEEGLRELLHRASRFACYALLNKLVFHEALLKRHGNHLSKLAVPLHIDTGEKLRLHLETYFAEAVRVTGDYETVFGVDKAALGDRLPFYSDSAVVHWRSLIDEIHEFDFSKLDYEVIGSIFELLIAPEERKKYGQYYTRVEVVDLINSFCLLRGDEKVMDPACGGGTFLVRAYARKRELMPDRMHAQRLAELFGVDRERFAAHLTTINLATRDLVDAENYPQIARSDFFDITPQGTFVALPKHIEAKGLGKLAHRQVKVPPLDAVVGNPPYIQQEDIPKTKKKGNTAPQHGTKEYYQRLIQREASTRLSGRSDIHCYFWPHSAFFLKEDGFLCLITSSQWLDVEYGFRLQEWILRNFRIVALFESEDEPWFVGARVATTVTILQREKEASKRRNNTVRFVQLRKPIAEVLSHDGTALGAFLAADSLRDEVLGLEENVVNDRFRARLIKQGMLWEEGVRLGALMGKAGTDLDDESECQNGEYFGGKWGMYIRAPDLWFKLLESVGERMARLGAIADVKYGLKSGRDDFFYVKDVTADYLSRYEDEEQFAEATGYRRSIFADGSVMLVACDEGDSSLKALEARFLEPEIHSLMEIDSYCVSEEDCARFVLLVSTAAEDLDDTHALDYIKWGESKKWHEGSTCASRVTQDRDWYDLTGRARAPVLWAKERQYRQVAPANESRLIANCRLYEIYPPAELDDPLLWGGILNSTWVLLSAYQFGRPVGNEGNWSTMVVDVNMMLVPDPRKASPRQRKNVSRRFAALRERKALPFLSERRLRKKTLLSKGREDDLDGLSDACELDLRDRRELDDAVLEMMGVASKQQRCRLLDELYAHLTRFFERTRRKEEKAIDNKGRSRRRGVPKPRELARQILETINEKHGQLAKRYDRDFFDADKPFDAVEVPVGGDPSAVGTIYGKRVEFVKGTKKVALLDFDLPAQADLVALLAVNAMRGLVRIPHEQAECERVYAEFRTYIERRNKRLTKLIRERIPDEDVQESVYDELVTLLAK